jgi:hypothetical protein
MGRSNPPKGQIEQRMIDALEGARIVDGLAAESRLEAAYPGQGIGWIITPRDSEQIIADGASLFCPAHCFRL